MVVQPYDVRGRAGSEGAFDGLAKQGVGRIGEEVPDVAADEVVPVLAEQPRGRTVDVEILQLPVEEDKAVGQVLEEVRG